MKVTLEKDYRKLYTLDDLDRAKKVIAIQKDDDMPMKDWCKYAVGEALKGTGDYFEEMLKGEAHTAKNCRAMNKYFDGERLDDGVYIDGSLDMDVWLKFTARTSKGFIIVGAYLSDVWETGGTTYKHREFIRYFTEK